MCCGHLTLSDPEHMQNQNCLNVAAGQCAWAQVAHRVLRLPPCRDVQGAPANRLPAHPGAGHAKAPWARGKLLCCGQTFFCPWASKTKEREQPSRRSFLISFAEADVRMPENVRHSHEAVWMSSVLFYMALLCLPGCSQLWSLTLFQESTVNISTVFP